MMSGRGAGAGSGGPAGGGGGGGARGGTRRAGRGRPAWPTFKRAVALLWPHRLLVVAFLLTIAFSSLIGLAAPLLIRQITHHALPEGQCVQFNLLVLHMLAALFSGALSGLLQSFLSNSVS